MASNPEITNENIVNNVQETLCFDIYELCTKPS